MFFGTNARTLKRQPYSRLCTSRNFRPRLLRALCALSVMLSISTTASASERSVTKADTSAKTRNEAIRAIPLSQLEPEQHKKVASMLTKDSIFRRLPTQVFDCEHYLYSFLVRNPEVVVNIWEVMGISQIALKRQSSTQYVADDGAGTTGTLEFLYSDRNTQIIYAEGSYEGPMFQRKIHGRCLLVVKSGYFRESNGRHNVSTQVDTFLQIENGGVEFIARTFQPLVGKLADHNLTETTAFVSSLSRTAEVNSPGVIRLAQRLENVATPIRQAFMTITSEVGDRLLASEEAATYRAMQSAHVEPVPAQSESPQPRVGGFNYRR